MALNSNITDQFTVSRARQQLNELALNNNVTIRWIRAHVGTEGNERADELAKQAANDIPMGPEPTLPIPFATIKNYVNEYVYAQWKEYWLNIKDHRQTKLFYPEPRPESRKLIYYDRNRFSRLVRGLTGHDFRRRHSHILDPDVEPNPTCRFCQNSELETVEHLITTCPRFTERRVHHLNDLRLLFGQDRTHIDKSWTLQQIASFLLDDSMSSMEDKPIIEQREDVY